MSFAMPSFGRGKWVRLRTGLPEPEPEPAPEAVSVGQPEQAPRQMAANDAELEQIMREVEEIERTSTRPGPNTEDGESVWRDD